MRASGDGLSPAALSVWGKSGRSGPGWVPLWLHLADTMEVASHLWDHRLSDSEKSTMAGVIGDQAKPFLVFLAGIHDVGKAFAPFNGKDPVLAARAASEGLLPCGRLAGFDTGAHHDAVGALALEARLEDLGWNAMQREAMSGIIAGHHGSTLAPRTLRDVRKSMTPRASTRIPEKANVGPWVNVMRELIDWARDFSGVDLSSDGPLAHLPRSVQVPYLGWLVLSDWIASSQYPTISPRSDGRGVARPDIVKVARATGIDSRWSITGEPGDASAWLDRRFPGAQARPIQDAVFSVADTCSPSIMVISAPMGEGKTEAGLIAATKFAQKVGANGVFFALPTMATANSIYERAVNWFTVAGHSPSVYLAHSMNDQFEPFRSLDHAPSGAHVEKWLTSNRRTAAFSDLVVGTVDQLISAARNSRHAPLRMAGVLGKVVLIDEVHSYDAYMMEYLYRTLEWLGSEGVPVVAMSATLTSQASHRLVEAYRKGMRGNQRKMPQKTCHADSSSLVTYLRVRPDKVRIEEKPVGVSERGAKVHITRVGDKDDDLTSILESRLADREGCVAVIRNTVQRAQTAYRKLHAVYGDAVVLLHSRFIGPDRQEKEERLVSELGRGGNRPDFRIVVATQVIEQSLDLDFDLMVSDLAPVDMVLQRMGRLHRHSGRHRPASMKVPEMILATGSWKGDIPVPSIPSTFVYGEYPLLTAGVIFSMLTEVLLPDDIPRLVEMAAGDSWWKSTPCEAYLEHECAKYEQVVEEYRRQAEGSLLVTSATGRDGQNIWSLGHSANKDEEVASGGVRLDDGSYRAVLLVSQRSPSWAHTSALDAEASTRTSALWGQGKVPSADVLRAANSITVPLPRGLSRSLDAATSQWWRDGGGTTRRASQMHVLNMEYTGADEGSYHGSFNSIGLNYSKEMGLWRSET